MNQTLKSPNKRTQALRPTEISLFQRNSLVLKFSSLVPIAVATVGMTLTLNLPVQANTLRSLPSTLVGGSVLEDIEPSLFSPNLVSMILEKAASDLGLSNSALQILSVQKIVWNDGCRGNYIPGTACTRALVPGWRMLVTDGTQEWIYHSTEQNAWQWPESSRFPPDCVHLFTGRRCRNFPGISQNNPILPDRTANNWFVFENVESGNWFDPPTEYGFQYAMTGDSRFTQILDFPVGIDSDDLFQVLAGNRILGEFRVGETVNFLALLGEGVTEFTIAGIQGAIAPDSPVAFPTRLAFDRPTASFKMRAISPAQSVPEPQSAIALLTLAMLGRGMRNKKARSPK